MAAKQTEGKITALYERLSRETATPSSIKNHTSKAAQGKEAMKTSSTIPTTVIRAVTLTVLLGNG